MKPLLILYSLKSKPVNRSTYHFICQQKLNAIFLFPGTDSKYADNPNVQQIKISTSDIYLHINKQIEVGIAKNYDLFLIFSNNIPFNKRLYSHIKSVRKKNHFIAYFQGNRQSATYDYPFNVIDKFGTNFSLVISNYAFNKNGFFRPFGDSFALDYIFRYLTKLNEVRFCTSQKRGRAQKTISPSIISVLVLNSIKNFLVRQFTITLIKELLKNLKIHHLTAGFVQVILHFFRKTQHSTIQTINTSEFGYNGSILALRKKYLLFYRHEDNTSHDPIYLRAIYLDKNFSPYGPSYLLKKYYYDPRAFQFQGQSYISYTNNVYTSISPVLINSLTREIHLGNQVTFNQANFSLALPEKNWLPFEFNNQLLAVYSFNPHRIVNLDLNTGQVKLVYETTISYPWKHGYVSNGSIPVNLNQNEFISFFHSWTADNNNYRQSPRKYYLGAYTFSSKPPFNILRAVSSPIIFPDQYSAPKNYIHQVIFPTTALSTDNGFTIFYGENDSTTKARFFSREYLESVLIPVK